MGKKIITITEIVFALVFVIIMAMIIGNVVGFGEDSNDRLVSIRETVADAELEEYNGSIISGDTVISTINKLQEINNIKLSYGVYDGSTWHFYGSMKLDTSGDGSLFDGNGAEIAGIKMTSTSSNYQKYIIATQPGDTGYISPVQEFESSLAFNSNGVLVGMLFRQA